MSANDIFIAFGASLAFLMFLAAGLFMTRDPEKRFFQKP